MSHYQHFEPSFPIPDSWEWVRLEEIIEDFKYGTSAKSFKSGKMPVLRMGNLTRNGKISYSDLVYTDSANDIAEYNLKKGDILFNRTNSNEWVGKAALYDAVVPAIYAGYLIRLRTIMVLSEYLIVVMTSRYYRNWCHSVKTDAVNQSNINATKLSNFVLPLPPLNEQKRIVHAYQSYDKIISLLEIDKIDITNIIAQTKSKILDLAMQGKLVPQNPADEPGADMLRRINPKAKIITDNPHYPQLPENWVLTTIDSVCLYGNSKTIPVSDIDAEDWILELEDMESYTGRLLQIKSKKERVISGSRNSFKSGDILFSRLRTYLNKVHLSTNRGFCSTEMIPITPFKCVLSEYLYYWLRSPFFIEYTISCGYGVKMPRLSTSDANKAIVPLPPLDEQKRIVETIQRFHEGFDRISNALN